MQTIEVQGVSRTFRSVKKNAGIRGTLQLLWKPEHVENRALKELNFKIRPGEFIGLIGANGAGKTTLLKILSGLIPPTTGTAKVLGFDPFSRPLAFRRKIALVMGQKAQLWWDLPAIDAFDLNRAIYEIPFSLYKERLDILTDLLDVRRHLHTQLRRLSLGERMKMELIGALIHWPSVIFLDEPTIGLDVLAAHKLRQFLSEFNRRERATIILTSHNMEDIQRLCPRVLILKSGELIYDGPPSTLTRQDERRLRLRLLECPTPQELSEVTGISIESIVVETATDDEQRPVYLSVHQDRIVDVLQKVMTRYQVVDMGIEEQSLESVIQRLYEDRS